MFNETDEYREEIARKLCELDAQNFDELHEVSNILFDEKTRSDYYWAADQVLSLFPALAQREKIAKKLCTLDKLNFEELSEIHSVLFDEKTRSDYYWAADQVLSLFPALPLNEEKIQSILSNRTGSTKSPKVNPN